MSNKKSSSHSRRLYWIELIVYSSPNTFMPLLRKADRWAYAYHDLDKNDDGTWKEPHYHIIVHFENARSINACKRDILSTQNVLGKEITSVMGAYQYLWHENDLDKYQYDKSIVVSHNPVFWEGFLPDIRASDTTDFLEDLLNHVDMVTMAKRYGRDYMKNYRAYKDFVDEVEFQERLKNTYGVK